MKKVAVIGHYAFSFEYLDGQTIKTKIVSNELSKYYGDENVLKIDTHGGKKTLFKAPFQVIRALKNAKNIIILPAQSYGKPHSVKTDDRLQTLSLLSSNLSMTNIIKKHRKLLPAKIKVKNLLKNGLKHLPTGIYNTLKSVIHKTGD